MDNTDKPVPIKFGAGSVQLSTLGEGGMVVGEGLPVPVPVMPQRPVALPADQ